MFVIDALIDATHLKLYTPKMITKMNMTKNCQNYLNGTKGESQVDDINIKLNQEQSKQSNQPSLPCDIYTTGRLSKWKGYVARIVKSLHTMGEPDSVQQPKTVFRVKWRFKSSKESSFQIIL